MTWMLTHSRRHFDFANPQPEQIDIMDIALGLARECRFGGQTHGHWEGYSVAQHSVHASHIVAPQHALEALLHDASEAYCKDLPSPLKGLLPDYQQIEARVDLAIRQKFRLPEQASPEVKHADLVMLATERRDLMPTDGAAWAILEGIEPLPDTLTPLGPRDAYKLFMARWIDLIADRHVNAPLYHPLGVGA